jgi:hypothetical protein
VKCNIGKGLDSKITFGEGNLLSKRAFSLGFSFSKLKNGVLEIFGARMVSFIEG